MNATGIKFEVLNKENYDTWKIQMRAVLIKNNSWDYVSGKKVKPEVKPEDSTSTAAATKWEDEDLKAQSDLVLAISPAEIKQIKGCKTSHQIWTKLEEIYQSKGPMRKAALLNKLMAQKMQDGDDAREYTNRFFDVVDKISEMDIEINNDLLAVILLRSLPEKYENFRCAISSRDELPSPEAIRIKITEEFEARKPTSNEGVPNAMAAFKHKNSSRAKTTPQNSGNKDARMKCFNCGRIGHRASVCRSAKKPSDSSQNHDKIALYASLGSQSGKAYQASEKNSRDLWCLDSGCTSHLCKDARFFRELDERERGTLNLASNENAAIEGKGLVTATVKAANGAKTLDLRDAFLVPDLRANLISVSKVTDRGYRVIFSDTRAEIVDKDGNAKLVANRVNDLYCLEGSGEAASCLEATVQRSSKESRNTLEDWHIRLGHLNLTYLRDAARKGSMRGLKIKGADNDFDCEICLQGKMARLPFPKESTRKCNVGDLIDSDVCGPIRIESHARSRLFCTFIGDASGWCEVRFLRQKNEVLSEFEKFRALMLTQRDKKIKMLQSDNGLEFVNKEFVQLLEKHGIHHRLTVPYTPEQNGVAERRNRTLMEMARCLLLQSNLPGSFWAEAVNTANYILNRCPTRKLDGRTPYEVWYGEPPDVSYFQRFGSQVYVLDKKLGKSKLDPRSETGLFLGYSSESKAYRVWLPEQKKVTIARDVRFIGSTAVQQAEPINGSDDPFEGSYVETTKQIDSHETTQEDATSRAEAADSEPEEFRGFSLDEQDEVRWPFPGEVLNEDGFRGPNLGDMPAANAASPRRTGENESGIFAFTAELPVREALDGPEHNEWIEAMSTEVLSIIKNRTWDVVDRPPDADVVGSRFVLCNKFGANGDLEKRKARIVAKGYTQQYGRDFHETFAPVARLDSIRLAMALAVQKGMHIQQFDVTTAYLNGDLEETIFMEAPKEIIQVLRHIVEDERNDPSLVNESKNMISALHKGNRVCQLRKALYGLKQASRAWYKRFDQELKNAGAIPTAGDPCVYIRKSGKAETIILIYVDDVLVLSRDLQEIKNIEIHLRASFDLKSLGDLHRCLGLDFKVNKQSISLNQRTYVNSVLKRFKMEDYHAVSTPIAAGTRLTKGDIWTSADGTKPPYRELIGCLLYLARATRPDIAHAVSMLSQFNDCFGKLHWTAAKRVLRYLKGTAELGITYKHEKSDLVGYVDADYAGDLEDRRSFTGYAFILSGGPVTWDSKKQKTTAVSTTEATTENNRE